jgi:hypothetical protein
MAWNQAATCELATPRQMYLQAEEKLPRYFLQVRGCSKLAVKSQRGTGSAGQAEEREDVGWSRRKQRGEADRTSET